MGKFAMYVKFEARGGQRDALVSVLSEAADVVGAIPECVVYLVSTDRDDEDGVCVIEVWSNEAAHSESLRRDDVRAVVRRGMPLISGISAQARLAVVGGHLGAPPP